ncbi:MAG: hypothetical protein EOO52_14110 [Gammaproteobacteria bacterium]|nr:MAG: hypothetical protein EOO52_14110 [Gammaproteobacteria bacterium]
MTITRQSMLKLIVVITLLFQLINIAWASNHSCCPENNPGCVMADMAMGCTACLAIALPAAELNRFNESRALIKMVHAAPNYLSVNNHVIWRPPIFSPVV